jgi:hypothetical protein
VQTIIANPWGKMGMSGSRGKDAHGGALPCRALIRSAPGQARLIAGSKGRYSDVLAQEAIASPRVKLVRDDLLASQALRSSRLACSS